MTTQHNPAEIAKLIAEAIAADDVTHREEPACGCKDRNFVEVFGEHPDADCPAKVHRRAVVDAWIWKESNLRAMADQLEAAQAEIERLKDWQSQDEGEIYRLTSDCEALSIERDDAKKVAAASIGDGALRRWQESVRAQRQQASHIANLTAERDKLQAQLEAVRPVVAEMRPVVEAAVLERQARCTCNAEFWHYARCARFDVENNLARAVDAYRAARDKAESGVIQGELEKYAARKPWDKGGES